jgi:hypothetical protein
MTAKIGHNGGEPLSKLDALIIDADDLVAEADSLTVIENEAQHAAVKDLIDRAKVSAKAIDAAKAEEKRPFLDANIAIEAAYKPVKAKADAAVTTAQKVIQPWLVAQQAKRDTEAKALRDEAERIAREAAAMVVDDATTSLDRDNAIETAALIKSEARKLEKVATGLVTRYDATITNNGEFLAHLKATRRDDVNAWLQSEADKLARGTRGTVPGVTFIERKEAR